MVRSILSSLALVATLVVSAACGSDSGEACRATGDCSSGLVCCNGGQIASGGARGACQRECIATSNPVLDSGSEAGTSGDASTDDASTGDASTGDASTGDASTDDASTDDASTDDAGDASGP